MLNPTKFVRIGRIDITEPFIKVSGKYITKKWVRIPYLLKYSLNGLTTKKIIDECSAIDNKEYSMTGYYYDAIKSLSKANIINYNRKLKLWDIGENFYIFNEWVKEFIFEYCEE